MSFARRFLKPILQEILEGYLGDPSEAVDKLEEAITERLREKGPELLKELVERLKARAEATENEFDDIAVELIEEWLSKAEGVEA